jgi:hypothetical protein
LDCLIDTSVEDNKENHAQKFQASAICLSMKKLFERHNKVESELWARCDRLYRIAPGTKRYEGSFGILINKVAENG